MFQKKKGERKQLDLAETRNHLNLRQSFGYFEWKLRIDFSAYILLDVLKILQIIILQSNTC